MMQEIIDKKAFEIITLPNNLVLICKFKDHNLVFYSLCMICEICISAKIWFVKTSTLDKTNKLICQKKIEGVSVFGVTSIVYYHL